MANSAYAPKAGEPAGKEKKEGDDKAKKLAPQEVDLAVAELRYQTAFYLEAVQAMMDGVVLGAEHVQDKRIELLEAGPTTDPEAVILTIVITLVLEGTVGPAIASLATRAMLRPVMRATAKAINRQARRDMGLMKYNARLYRTMAKDMRNQAGPGIFSWEGDKDKQLLAMAKELEHSAKKLTQDLRGQSGSTKPIRSALNGITNFVENNLVAAAKVPGAVKGLPGSDIPLQAGGSPGVDVVAAAMASASRLRLTVVATHEALEVEIKHPDTTLKEVTAILDEYRADGDVDLAHIRASFMLATEAMIWAGLLLTPSLKQHIELRKTPIAPGDRGVPYGALFTARLDADPKLIQYLEQRFGKEVERWALEKNIMLVPELKRAGNPYAVPPRPTGWWEGLDKGNRGDLLALYLSSVADGTPSTELKLQ